METLQKINPATPVSAKSRERQPWHSPTSKIAVSEIPGYKLYWFRGEDGRIQRAMTAGWEFVDKREAQIYETGLGNPLGADASVDLGSRITIASGSADGSAGRLVLMKLKLEYWHEEQEIKAERNERVAAAIRGGNLGENERGNDPKTRYVDKTRTVVPDLFTPKRQLGAS
jgi:hypothetical protein